MLKTQGFLTHHEDEWIEILTSHLTFGLSTITLQSVCATSPRERMTRYCSMMSSPPPCQAPVWSLAILSQFDELLVNYFSFQCLLLNLFFSFSWTEPEDMWELPSQTGKVSDAGVSVQWTTLNCIYVLAEWQDILKGLRWRDMTLALGALWNSQEQLLPPHYSAHLTSAPNRCWPTVLLAFPQSPQAFLYSWDCCQAMVVELPIVSLILGTAGRSPNPRSWHGRMWWFYPAGGGWQRVRGISTLLTCLLWAVDIWAFSSPMSLKQQMTKPAGPI